MQLEYLRDGGHWEIIAYAPIEHEAAWRALIAETDRLISILRTVTT